METRRGGFRYTDGPVLTSAGGGDRVFFANDVQADIGIGVPLNYRALDNPTRDVRVPLSLTSALKFCSARWARCPYVRLGHERQNSI